MVRMNDSSVDVPVSGEKCTTTAANRTDTTAVPKNFWNFDRPSERSLRTFRKSSRNPTIANPTAANSKRETRGRQVLEREPRREEARRTGRSR